MTLKYYTNTTHTYCLQNFKDAMPISFRSELFTSYILTIYKQRNLLPTNIRNCQIQLFMHVNILQKHVFVEDVWPANLALFVYVSTHCVETVKWFDYNRYFQLTWWCSGNASALGARGSGFNPRLRQGFLCLIFLFCCCCVFTFLSKNTSFITKVCNSFYIVNLFSIPNILQDL